MRQWYQGVQQLDKTAALGFTTHQSTWNSSEEDEPFTSESREEFKGENQKKSAWMCRLFLRYTHAFWQQKLSLQQPFQLPRAVGFLDCCWPSLSPQFWVVVHSNSATGINFFSPSLLVVMWLSAVSGQPTSCKTHRLHPLCNRWADNSI